MRKFPRNGKVGQRGTHTQAIHSLSANGLTSIGKDKNQETGARVNEIKEATEVNIYDKEI